MRVYECMRVSVFASVHVIYSNHYALFTTRRDAPNSSSCARWHWRWRACEISGLRSSSVYCWYSYSRSSCTYGACCACAGSARRAHKPSSWRVTSPLSSRLTSRLTVLVWWATRLRAFPTSMYSVPENRSRVRKPESQRSGQVVHGISIVSR